MAGRQELGDAAEVPERGLKTFKAGGTAVVVARVDGGFCAVDHKCPHLGGNMGGGRLEGRAIVCPVHGSRFDMCTGQVLAWAPKMPGLARRLGSIVKRPTPIQSHRVEEEGGKLYLAG